MSCAVPRPATGVASSVGSNSGETSGRKGTGEELPNPNGAAVFHAADTVPHGTPVRVPLGRPQQAGTLSGP